MATKVGKKASARPVLTLDLTKAVKVSATSKPRSKGEVFGTIANTSAFTVATWPACFTSWAP